MAYFERYYDYNIMLDLYMNHNSKDEVNRINITHSKIYISKNGWKSTYFK